MIFCFVPNILLSFLPSLAKILRGKKGKFKEKLEANLTNKNIKYMYKDTLDFFSDSIIEDFPKSIHIFSNIKE